MPAAKESKDTVNPPSIDEKASAPNLSHSIFRGVSTALLCPVISVGFDQLQTKLEADPHLKITKGAIRDLVRGCYKAYPFIAGTNIIRYSINYTTGPNIEYLFRKQGVEAQRSQSLGYLGAGFIDGIMSGIFSPIKQRYFLHNEGTSFKAAVSKEMRQQSYIATRYVLPRNSLYWWAYNRFVNQMRSAIQVQNDSNVLTRSTKELAIGGVAGFGAMLFTHPFDSFKTRRIQKPEIGLKQIIVDGVKEHGIKVIPKVFYRGMSVGLFRMPAVMAANAYGVYVADSLFEKSNKPKV